MNGTHPFFSAMCTMGDKFCDFLFTSLEAGGYYSSFKQGSAIKEFAHS